MEAHRSPRSVFWDWDLEHGRVLWAGALAELLGDTPEGDRAGWERRIVPRDLGAVRTMIDELRRGRRHRGEVRYRVATADGGSIAVRDSMVLVEHRGCPHRIVGTIQPADASRLGPPGGSLADRLALSEHRFQTFIEGLPLLAWEADADGWIDYYNRPWYEYTGTTLEEMEGWGWVRVHDPLDLPRVLRVYRNAIQSGRPWEDEFRLRRADGALRWHLSRAMPLRDAEGRIVRWFGTNTDTHDQRLALEERERLLQAEHQLRRAAEQASREKDEFLAIVSHELRTPLSAILTRVEMLEIHGSLPPLMATSVGKIHQSTLTLAGLIDDLLDVSRIISGKLEIEREPVDVLEPVQRALDALQEDARRKGLLLQLETRGPAVVVGSTARLQQIATNLVSNAIKFSEHAGSIEVSVSTEGGEVVIAVRDHGQGIAPDLLPRLFERFRQGDASSRRRSGGLGLGLSIARTLTELHGGTITASSAGPGMGATFTVRLPASDATVVARAAAEAGTRPVSLQGIRVLGIDDDPEGREVLAMALLGYQATVTVAASAAEAFEQLRVETPDVVVSDIAMPEVDGYAFVERLRAASDPRIRVLPVIALTAHASTQDRADALQRGFSSYVSKPYDSASLARLIAELVASQAGTDG